MATERTDTISAPFVDRVILAWTEIGERSQGVESSARDIVLESARAWAIDPNDEGKVYEALVSIAAQLGWGEGQGLD